MKLVAAIIVTGVTLAIAVSGYGLIGMNSRVASKFERSNTLTALRHRIKEQVACRASQNAVCEGGDSELRFKMPLEEKESIKWVRNRDPSVFSRSPFVRILLTSTCNSRGEVKLEYLMIKNGKPVTDPVSRLPTRWLPLYADSLCKQGHLATQWPN